MQESLVKKLIDVFNAIEGKNKLFSEIWGNLFDLIFAQKEGKDRRSYELWNIIFFQLYRGRIIILKKFPQELQLKIEERLDQIFNFSELQVRLFAILNEFKPKELTSN